MSIIQRFEEACNLPQDILSNAPLIRLCGSYSLNIRNYKGLVAFTETNILLQCHHCRVKVLGKDLWIHYYDPYEMEIKGFIQTISIIA